MELFKQRKGNLKRRGTLNAADVFGVVLNPLGKLQSKLNCEQRYKEMYHDESKQNLKLWKELRKWRDIDAKQSNKPHRIMFMITKDIPKGELWDICSCCSRDFCDCKAGEDGICLSKCFEDYYED